MKLVFFVLLNLITATCFGQTDDHTLVKDLDHDGLKDSVLVSHPKNRLVVKLSSQGFRPVSSGGAINYSHSYLSDEGDGFTYHALYMRAAFSAGFHYDKSAKRIRLTALGEWNASSGMSGGDEVDFDLLSGVLTINSEYWDKKRNKWGNNKPIEKKMYYPKIYLSNFTTAIVDFFRNEDAKLAWGYSDQNLALAEDSISVKTGYQYTWLGNLGKNIPVFIHFQPVSKYSNANKTTEDERRLIEGEITYLKTQNQTPIPLIGYQNGAKIRLNEYASGGIITGIIKGQIKGQMFTGNWYKPHTNHHYKMGLTYFGMKIPNKDLTVKPNNIFGKYHYQYGQKGYEGNLELRKINARKAVLSIFSVTSAPARNIADGVDNDTIPLPVKTDFIHKVYGRGNCKVELHFFKNFVRVIYPQEADCNHAFGMNATYEGIYFNVKDE